VSTNFPRSDRYPFGKSLPTTAMSPGFWKKLDEIAAYVAAPPSAFFIVLEGS